MSGLNQQSFSPNFLPHNTMGNFGPELTPEQQKKKLQTPLMLAGMAAGMPGQAAEKIQAGYLQQTVKQWIEAARPGVTKSIPYAQQALAGVAQLPPELRGHWQGRMQILVNYATANPPDPISIIRYINSIEPEVQQLASLPLVQPSPLIASLGVPPGVPQQLKVQSDVNPALVGQGTHPSVKLIQNALQTFRANIGVLHPGVQYTDRFAQYDKKLAAAEGNVIRMGLFVVGIGMGLLMTILTLLRKPEDRAWTPAMVYLGIAALAFGWGAMNRSGTDNLERQIDWLASPGGWDALQNSYNIRGPVWATFTQNLYNTRGKDSNIALAMSATTAITDAQRKAVLAQTPPNIQKEVTALLDSAGPPKGRDFKTFSGFVLRAVTPDARGIVIAYLQSGSSRQSLAILAEQQGTQDKIKKEAQAKNPPPAAPMQPTVPNPFPSI